jgi:transposase, IS5 family
MTRWRQRIGPERLEVLLAETVEAARRGGAVEEKHLRRVTIDTTVQPKAVTHPTDSKLLHRGIEILARLARRHRIKLRQSYLRVARRARREAAQLIHSGRPRQAERHVRHLRTWLGRLLRDIGRKIAGDATAEVPPSPGPSGSSRACCGRGARTAAATSSTRCTRRRRSASARARPMHGSSSG